MASSQSSSWLSRLDRAISAGFLFRGSRILMVFGAVIMFAMVAISFVTIVVRRLPFIPSAFIAGSYELAEVLMGGLSVFAVAYCWYAGGHIRIGIVRDRLSPRKKAVLDALGALLALGWVVAIAWTLWGMGIDRLHWAKGTPVYKVQTGQMTTAFAITMWFFAVVLVRSIIGLAAKAAGRKVEHDGLY